ncbi:hypothetical protein WN55_10085 [Dufourea novaeangliae]|uniref:Uncharacterized protein n=1 Tax=Dufourea novaeangliae TaxID=178035 RepID=A0A154P7N9_DUFNO|nr:hypothetical protein WN55_10085 [Dufourea novaeangliae]
MIDHGKMEEMLKPTKPEIQIHNEKHILNYMQLKIFLENSSQHQATHSKYQKNTQRTHQP